MRVHRQPDYEALIRLTETVRLDQPVGDDADGLSLGDLLAGTPPPDDPNDVIEEELFRKLTAGVERTIVILRSDGYTQKSICHITGLTEHQVRTAIQQVRQRFSRKPVAAQAVLPFRVFDRKTTKLFYVETLVGMHQKHLRVMRPTGYQDVTGRPIYEWDIVQAEGTTKVVTYWRNKLGNGFSPFDTKEEKIDWQARTRVIGNVWQKAASRPHANR
jgi:hypothetical protein